MKNFLIFFCGEDLCDKVCDCVDKLKLLSDDWSQQPLFKKLITDVDFNEISKSKSQNEEWIELKDVVSTEEFEGTRTYTYEKDGKSRDTASVIHDLTNSLPYLGINICVLIMLSPNNISSRESFLPLAGALKRLVDWHNARLHFLKLFPALSEFGTLLTKFVPCEITHSLEDLNIQWPLWGGKVSVMDQIDSRGHVFSGFSLHCEDWDKVVRQKLTVQPVSSDKTSQTRKRSKKHTNTPGYHHMTVLGRTIEILQEVDLRTFPLYLLDSWILRLSVCSGFSQTLIDYVQDMQQTGLLSRLRLYPERTLIPCCAEVESLNTTSWKNSIIDNYQSIVEPVEEQVADDSEFLYILILPNLSVDSASTSPTTGAVSVKAQLLLSPRELNWKMLECAETQTLLQSFPPVSRAVGEGGEAIMKLPVLEGGKFGEMLGLISEAQEGAVKDNLNQSQELSEKKLKDILQETQEEVTSKVFNTCTTTLRQHKEKTSGKTFLDQFQWVPEASLDSSKFPERIALQAEESGRKLFEQCPSVDSQPASSPLCLSNLEKKKVSKNFDFEDVLRVFKKDGTHIPIHLSPVKLKGHKLCRIASQPDLNAPWPASQYIQYHDVYHYNDEADLEFEKTYASYRDKGFFTDTLSSFVSPIKKKSQLREVRAMTAVRTSPRRSASFHSLLSRSRTCSDGLSPSQKNAMFKQPTSRAYSKSPKKQLLRASTPKYPAKETKSTNKVQVSPNLTPVPRVSSRSPCKKLSLSPDNQVPDSSKSSKKRLAHLSDAPVRRSPRKSSSGLFGSTTALEKQKSDTSSLDSSRQNDSSSSSSQSQTAENNGSTKMSRSQRHKMRLQKIVEMVLEDNGVRRDNPIHDPCSRNLFNVSLVLLKTLPNSKNLTEEMKNVVTSQVQQIINLEKRRSGITI